MVLSDRTQATVNIWIINGYLESWGYPKFVGCLQRIPTTRYLVDPEKPAMLQDRFADLLFGKMKPGSKIEAKSLLPAAAASESSFRLH